MSQVTDKLMTAEEFAEWVGLPENEGKSWELDRGRLVEMPRPGYKHCLACGLVTHILQLYAFGRGQGAIAPNDCGLVIAHDPGTVRSPDVMFHLDQQAFDEATPKWAEFVPTLVVEVLSPTDRINKTTARIGQYLDRGVPMVWLVDPEVHSVAIYRPGQFPQVLDNSDELAVGDVLPDFRCQVSDLFRMPGEPAKDTA